jgi:hypothetical protein
VLSVREGPDGWPALLRDVKDLPVRTVSEIGNGYMIIPAGTEGVITYGTTWNKLHFEAEPCSCCGVKMRVRAAMKKSFALR